jgi:hypothetical protein
VFTGSGSLLLHPSEFMESRNEAEAISSVQTAQVVAAATRFSESCSVCEACLQRRDSGRWESGACGSGLQSSTSAKVMEPQ